LNPPAPYTGVDDIFSEVIVILTQLYRSCLVDCWMRQEECLHS